MSCCGQRRAAITAPAKPANNQTLARPAPRPPRAAVPGGAAAPVGVLVRYLQRTPVRVTGRSTGRLYQFSGSAPLQIVAVQDAQALLATPLFRRG